MEALVHCLPLLGLSGLIAFVMCVVLDGKRVC